MAVLEIALIAVLSVILAGTWIVLWLYQHGKIKSIPLCPRKTGDEVVPLTVDDWARDTQHSKVDVAEKGIVTDDILDENAVPIQKKEVNNVSEKLNAIECGVQVSRVRSCFNR